MSVSPLGKSATAKYITHTHARTHNAAAAHCLTVEISWSLSVRSHRRVYSTPNLKLHCSSADLRPLLLLCLQNLRARTHPRTITAMQSNSNQSAGVQMTVPVSQSSLPPLQQPPPPQQPQPLAVKTERTDEGYASPGSAPSTSPERKPLICAKCQHVINDRFYMQVMDRSWHDQCLRCDYCACQLGDAYNQSLFTRDNRVLCRTDYMR